MNVYVRDFSRELARQGVQVDIFTRSEDEHQPTVKHNLGNGARVIHIEAGPQYPIKVAEIANYIDEFVAGVLHFAEYDGVEYDLIHSHYWLSGLVAESLSNAWPGIQVIQMFHTLGHMKNRVAQSPGERAPTERIEGESWVIKFADRIIAATQAEYAQLHWLYGADIEKVKIIPPGVDLDRFSPTTREIAREAVGIPVDHKNILYAGRIEPLTGIDT
jgi:D-inositol-3-phosphate glycosyltransferase